MLTTLHIPLLPNSKITPSHLLLTATVQYLRSTSLRTIDASTVGIVSENSLQLATSSQFPQDSLNLLNAIRSEMKQNKLVQNPQLVVVASTALTSMEYNEATPVLYPMLYISLKNTTLSLDVLDDFQFESPLDCIFGILIDC